MAYDTATLQIARNLTQTSDSPTQTTSDNANMLWNAILNHHFPSYKGYGIAFDIPKVRSAAENFLRVKLAREKDSVVVVVALRRAGDNEEMGRKVLHHELVESMEKELDNTDFDIIYGVAGVGLSSSVVMVVKGGHPEIVQDWISDSTSEAAYKMMTISQASPVVHA
ncbi:hypothetical protein FRC03_007243 [Tulasnella sp. 419]|nr:hypothetical protein FRC03_007243 [Tulasnella sp. 419]